MRTLFTLLLCLSLFSSCEHLRKKIPVTKEIFTYKNATVYAGSTHYFFTDANGDQIDLPVSNVPEMEGELYVNMPPILLESTEGLEGPPGANPDAVGETFEFIRNDKGEVVEVKAVSGNNYAPAYFKGTWFKKGGGNKDILYFKNNSEMIELGDDRYFQWELIDDKIHYEEVPKTAGAKPAGGVYEVTTLSYNQLHLVDEKGQPIIYSQWETNAGPDGYIGRWDGPDGMYLNIFPAENGGYLVQEYTGVYKFEYDATADSNMIKFADDEETANFLAAGSGEDTGDKRLAGKQDCLVRLLNGKFMVGGFCRD